MVTQAQLDQASNTIILLFDELEALRATVQFAKDAKVAGIPLAQSEINALLTQYTNQKGILQTTFGQLP